VFDATEFLVVSFVIPGTLGFDSASGFWLIHSAPKFPPSKKDGYAWADNASDYGQMFLCFSFAYKSLDVICK
jgi:deoxyribonuclease-2